MELLRSTASEAAEPAPLDDADIESMEDGSVDAQSSPSKSRGVKRPAVKSSSRARNLRLSDDVHDRLWFLARQKRQSVSAVANDLLNRALPRWDLKKQS